MSLLTSLIGAGGGGSGAAIISKGNWDATTNTPALSSGVGVQGEFYVANPGGTLPAPIDGITSVPTGNWMMFNGTVWTEFDAGGAVISVNAKTGAVTLNSDEIPEGSTNLYLNAGSFGTLFSTKDTDDLAEGVTNLYWTDARFDTKFGFETTDNLAEGTVNEYWTVGRFDAALATKTTDDVAVGLLNLYYTDSLFGSSFATRTTDNLAQGATNKYYASSLFNADFALQNTDGLSQGSTNLYYATGLFNADLATKTTDNLAEGAANFYWTQTRFNTAFGAKSTTNLPEGTNLYWTQARFDSAFGTRDTDDLPQGAVNKYSTQTTFDTFFNAKSTTNLSEGTNLYYTNDRADNRIAIQKGANNGLATLGADGLVPTAQLPAIPAGAVFVVADQAARLALSGAVVGDLCKQTDNSKTYVLQTLPPSVNGNWVDIGSSGAVDSVNGFTGNVTLTTTDISEGTNLYWTQARFNGAFSAKDTDDLAEGATNKYFTAAAFTTQFATKDTDNLAEGSANLYFTPARFATQLGLSNTDALAEGSINKYYATGLFNADLATKTTDNLSEGAANFYYTEGRFNASFTGKSTTDLSEGTNLYFTDTRADARANVQISAQKAQPNGLASLDGSGLVPAAQLPAGQATPAAQYNSFFGGTAVTNPANYGVTPTNVPSKGMLFDGIQFYTNEGGLTAKGGFVDNVLTIGGVLSRKQFYSLSSTATSLGIGNYAGISMFLSGGEFLPLSQGFRVGFIAKAGSAGTMTVSLRNSGESEVFAQDISLTTTVQEYWIDVPAGNYADPNWKFGDSEIGLELFFCMGSAETSPIPALGSWESSSARASSSQTDWIAVGNSAAGEFWYDMVTIIPLDQPQKLVPVSGPEASQRSFEFYEKSYDPGVMPGAVTSAGASVMIKPESFASDQFAGLNTHFKAIKFKTPTITSYSDATGSAGKVGMQIYGDGTVTSFGETSRSQTGQPKVTGAPSAVAIVVMQWEAEANITRP